MATVITTRKKGVEKMSRHLSRLKKQYTAIIRKSKLEYVAICIELNIAATGGDLAEVEKNLKDAVGTYLEDITEHPETEVAPITIEELVEFLNDTEPEWYDRIHKKKKLFLRPLEIHEVPVYV